MEIPETDSEDELPPGWEERCTADGLVFYAHHGSKSTRWTHPRTNKKKRVTGELPFGWEREITEEGKVFFVDHNNHKTTYTDPRLAFAIEETKGFDDLRQRFDSRSTGLHVLHGRDLSGQIAVITGANCGIGYETARSLIYHGCCVVFACRNLEKAESAIRRIKKERPYAQCHALFLDLKSLASVKEFAKIFVSTFEKCDILVLNAGVFGLPFELTEDGLETIFQVNFLSHLYLAILLKNSLSHTKSARIITLSSESHRFSTVNDKSDVAYEKLTKLNKEDYCSITAYNNSKLYNIYLAFELHRRYEDLGLRCFAVHPGNAVSSNLPRNWWIYKLIYGFVRPFTKSLQQACASTIYCATTPEMGKCSGLYINNCIPSHPAQISLDPTIGNKLWLSSLEIIENIMGKKAFTT